MSSKCIALYISIFLCLTGISQTDSVEYSFGTPIEDGLYLSYADFRSNKKISKDQINSNQDKEQLEFLSKVLANEKISFTRDSVGMTINSKDVWGYFQNNTFYINYKNDFYRVPVFGSISYLVAYVTVISPAFYDPRYALSMPSTTSKELKEFLMDFYDGNMVEFTTQNAETLLSRDEDLFYEYKKLSNKRKKEEIYRFIRRFNQAHPVYFLR